MAIDQIHPEISSSSSPRISFSHYLSHLDVEPKAKPPRPPHPPPSCPPHALEDTANDFNFCLSDGFDPQSSSADELFSDGKILAAVAVLFSGNVPSQHPESYTKPPSPPPSPPPLPPPQSPHHRHEDVLLDGNVNEGKIKNKDTKQRQCGHKRSTSFWRFGRSRSLSSANAFRPRLCFFPLMSRSYSTGSSPNVKQRQQQRIPPPPPFQATAAVTERSQSSSMKSHQKATGKRTESRNINKQKATQVSLILPRMCLG